MNDELEKILKGAGLSPIEVLSRTSMDELRKNYEKSSQDSDTIK
jgi:hypothetical protein